MNRTSFERNDMKPVENKPAGAPHRETERGALLRLLVSRRRAEQCSALRSGVQCARLSGNSHPVPLPFRPKLVILALLGALVVGLSTGCKSFSPAPSSYQPQVERAMTQTNGPIVATVATLDRSEAAKMFDLPLHKKGISPIWIRLQNRDTNGYYFLPASLDPDYYSPAEVAYAFRKMCRSKRNQTVDEFMETQQIPLMLPPGEITEGFVFSTLNQGAQHLRVELLGEKSFRQFEFVSYTPKRNYDFQRVEFEKLFTETVTTNYTLAELPEALKALPAATTDAKGTGGGDPLNLVVIGDQGSFSPAFGRQGWNVTEVLSFGNVFKLIGSFLFNRTWETSPVSPLYVFDRPQDFALQKARSTIHERNHLRLWLAPFTCEDKPVFAGQISRDIGLRFTFKAPGWVTHKIDPDIDEARDYLTQEMLTSGSVESVGWVEGTIKSTPAEPQRNLTGDPCYTDGLRVVLFLSNQPVSPSDVHFQVWSAAE